MWHKQRHNAAGIKFYWLQNKYTGWQSEDYSRKVELCAHELILWFRKCSNILRSLWSNLWHCSRGKKKFLRKKKFLTPRIPLRTHPSCLGKDFYWGKVALTIGRNFHWLYAYFWISFTWERIILPLMLSCVMALIFGAADAEGKSNGEVTITLLPPYEILISISLLLVPEASPSLPTWSLSNMAGSVRGKRSHQGNVFYPTFQETRVCE